MKVFYCFHDERWPMRGIFQNLHDFLIEGRVTLVDIGAAGGRHARWSSISRLLRVVGFEPNLDAYKKLRDTESERWFNYALSETRGKRTLYITRKPFNSSFLKPNKSLIDQLQWTGQKHTSDFDIVFRREVNCLTLDDVSDLAGTSPDYLKIDAQGSELEILRGGITALRNDILLAEIEVLFTPIYENQPHFSDVDAFMRSLGFNLHDIGNILYMKPKGMAGIGGPKGQIIFADTLYFKNISGQEDALYEREERKVYAAIIGYLIYGYPELALILLNALQKMGIHSKNLKKIQSYILSDRTFSPKLSRFPYSKRLLHRVLKLSSNLQEVTHCLLDVPLGNRSLSLGRWRRFIPGRFQALANPNQHDP